MLYMHTLYAMLPLVKQKRKESAAPTGLREQWLALWPAIKGSLAEVRKPCIRPQCPACARGDKHPNYLLAYSDQGRRRCLYVPKALVPALKRALANGRKLEQLLYQMGPALVREYRRQNPAQTGPAVRLRSKQPPAKS